MVLFLVGIYIFKTYHNQKLEKMRQNGVERNFKPEDIEARLATEPFPIPSGINVGLIGLFFVFMGLGLFNNIFFYAEPAYFYHVRSVFGEKIIDHTGYATHWFGRKNPWKKAMSVQAADNTQATIEDQVSDSESNTNVSANIRPQNITFLDQVDADASATVRFRLPITTEERLSLAHEYRTAANLLQTELIPAFKETLGATGMLMSAEEYYSGAKTEFNAEFQNQMENGIYMVRREEVRIDDNVTKQKGSANVSLESNQTPFGDNSRVIFKVRKLTDFEGEIRRKIQNFKAFGVGVVGARVTSMIPNAEFIVRMKAKQEASAKRAIAREERSQEEEQKLMVIAKGNREVAERQAKWRADQVEQTTKAETAKQLVLTQASQRKEQAVIDKVTAQIHKEKADIDAIRIAVLADADKYEREARIAGDNALQQKLDTEIAIQKVWAMAYSNRAVPQYVFGSNGEDGAPQGSDSETSRFMQLMTIQAAKTLGYDRTITPAATQ
jgi:hypothetical protein